jgi:hypothetical protein
VVFREALEVALGVVVNKTSTKPRVRVGFQAWRRRCRNIPRQSPVSPTRPRTAHLLMPLPHPARDHERSSAMTYASNPSHTHARGYTTHQLPSPTNHRHCSVSGQDLHLIYISLLSLSRSTPLPPSFPPPSLTLFDPCRHSCLPANKVQSR